MNEFYSARYLKKYRKQLGTLLYLGLLWVYGGDGRPLIIHYWSSSLLSAPHTLLHLLFQATFVNELSV